MTYRRVGGRHMVEAMRNLRSGIAHRATRYQPHHELDSFGTRFGDVLEMRLSGERLRIADELVEKSLVPGPIDEPGTRTLQLVAHAPGAPDLHIQGLVVERNRLGDRFAKEIAAPPRRNGILHHVDEERDDGTRPFGRLTEQQAERYGESVVDIDFIDDRQIEVVLDHRMSDMRGELRMPLDRGHRKGSPAFVGGP